MTAHVRDAAADAWQCAIDACFEHDCDHARRAVADLVSLGELVPAQRPATDPGSDPMPPTHRRPVRAEDLTPAEREALAIGLVRLFVDIDPPLTCARPAKRTRP